MLNTISKINTKSMSKEDLVKEYKNKLSNYTTSAGNVATHEYCDLSTCITIPIGDMNVIAETTGVGGDGKVNFNLFGRTTSELFSSNHVELSEIIIENDEIIIINRLVKMSDCNEKSFNDEANHTLDIETIRKICIVILDFYLCKNIVCDDLRGLFLEGCCTLEY